MLRNRIEKIIKAELGCPHHAAQSCNCEKVYAALASAIVKEIESNIEKYFQATFDGNGNMFVLKIIPRDQAIKKLEELK